LWDGPLCCPLLATMHFLAIVQVMGVGYAMMKGSAFSGQQFPSFSRHLPSSLSPSGAAKSSRDYSVCVDTLLSASWFVHNSREPSTQSRSLESSCSVAASLMLVLLTLIFLCSNHPNGRPAVQCQMIFHCLFHVVRLLLHSLIRCSACGLRKARSRL
jgi:hypothetical protein